MPLWNAGILLDNLKLHRLTWIGGRLGGFKTSLSFRLAKEFLKRGYRLISNTANVWEDDWGEVGLNENGHLKVVVVIDEIGEHIQQNKEVREIASYAAKMDIVFIAPGRWPPAKDFQFYTIEPWFNMVDAGIPAVIYKWQLKSMFDVERGFFIWFLPQEVYGVYSRQDPSQRAEGLTEWLLFRKAQYKDFHKRGNTAASAYKKEKWYAEWQELKEQKAGGDSISITSNGVSEVGTVGMEPALVLADSLDSYQEQTDRQAYIDSRKRGKKVRR